MRWEELFSELEAEVDADERAELAAEVADRTRWEVGQLSLADRLRASVGRQLRLDVLGVGVINGALSAIGPDWLLVELSFNRAVVLPLAAVLEVAGLPRAADTRTTPVSERLRLPAVLRGIARERSQVQITRVDGGLLSGTIDRVGAEHVDVGERVDGEPLAFAASYTVRTLSLTGIAAIQFAGEIRAQ